MSELVGFTADRPLLLLTSFPARAQGGGGVVLRSLLTGVEDQIVWGSPDTGGGADYPGRVAELSLGRRPWLSRPSTIARRIDNLADQHGAPAVWAVLHGALVPGLAEFTRRSRRPLHVSVHDDPAWAVAFRGRRERGLTPWLHLTATRALAGAESIDVISGGMRGAVAQRVGRDSTIVHRVVPGPIPPNSAPPAAEELVVGLLGSVYHPRQLAQLAHMLGRAGQLVQRRARLAVIGKEAPWMRAAVGDAPVEVVFHGHLDEPAGIDRLRQCFACYVGYPFGVRERVMRRTSFPAKVATYVQAARPLIIHSPYDSTLTPLLSRGSFTIPWVSGDIEPGAQTLAAAWRDEAFHGSQHEGAEAVRLQFFGSDNRTRLLETLSGLAPR